jgi:hypothetical protein
MNDPITSCRVLKLRIRSPSKPVANYRKILDDEESSKTDQVKILTKDHHRVNFSMCKPCFSVRSIQGLEVNSEGSVRLATRVLML